MRKSPSVTLPWLLAVNVIVGPTLVGAAGAEESVSLQSGSPSAPELESARLKVGH